MALRSYLLSENQATRITKISIAKNPSLSTEVSHLFDAWQFPTLAWGDPTLPSALRRFTSEFGMGSGGTTALVPPGKFCFIRTATHRDFSQRLAIRTNLGTSLKIYFSTLARSRVTLIKTPLVL